MKIEHNIGRLKYLLSLFDMKVDDLLQIISKGLKSPITQSDLFSEQIKVSHLKRIDKVFNKGLHYYLDPKSPEISKEASIFFRKNKFGSELNIGAKKIVNQFEEFKISLSALSKLAEIEIERTIPIYSLNDDPKIVAKEIRETLYPDFNHNSKEFLKSLIASFAERNILVFEFVETWNKKDKANIDGFFLNPNVIVLKRQQKSFRREIFTLAHELGHYLLNFEEIEEIEISNLADKNLSKIERWCNDFAFYFLSGKFNQVLENLERASENNDYHFDLVEKISRNTHLSQLALFTRLLFIDKVSSADYRNIKNDFDERYRHRLEEEQKKRELDKAKGIKQGGSTPKPINSPLLVSTIQTAFYEGLINEYDVCKSLKISPDKLEKYLQ